MTNLKDSVIEVLANCKVGLIGSGTFAATRILAFVAEVRGERAIHAIMVYLGFIVAILTIAKLSFEMYPAWVKFQQARKDEKERKQRRKKHD
jgi:hypothetical protein